MQPSAAESAEVQERLPLLASTVIDASKPSSYSTSSPPQRADLVYRRARLSDAKSMAYVATQAYLNSNLSEFLTPGRREFYSDWLYGYAHRYRLHLLSPNRICTVAIDSSTDQIVGAGIFGREGSDAAKKALVKKQWCLWKAVLLWWLPIQFKVSRWIWPDRSENKENTAVFLNEIMRARGFWDKYPERWHCNSFTVLPQYQRRGIGTKIMGDIQDICREEGVPLTLEASPVGELMYRARGFKMISRFGLEMPGEEDMGGMMIWDPSEEQV